MHVKGVRGGNGSMWPFGGLKTRKDIRYKNEGLLTDSDTETERQQ